MTTYFERAVAEGKIANRPYRPVGTTSTLTVDFDALHPTLVNYFGVYVGTVPEITAQYVGTRSQVNDSIADDIAVYCNVMLAQLYNKLRSTLEKLNPSMRTTLMNPRCPLSAALEFPRFLSSAFSSIGPLRIHDGPTERRLVYICPANTHNNYGRTAAPELNLVNYERLQRGLIAAGVDMAPIDFNNMQPSYFTTLSVETVDDLVNVHGAVHPSYYENQDVVRAFAFVCEGHPNNNLPFTDISTTIGYVDDATTFTALSAVANPTGVPATVTTITPGRPVGGQFIVNHLGIQPAVTAQGGTPARSAGFYVVGCGLYACTLAVRFGQEETFNMVREAIFARRGN